MKSKKITSIENKRLKDLIKLEAINFKKDEKKSVSTTNRRTKGNGKR